MNLRRNRLPAIIATTAAVIAATGLTSAASARTGNVVLTPQHGYNLTAVDHAGLPGKLTDGSLSYDHKGNGHFVGIKHGHLVYLIHKSGGNRWQAQDVGGTTTYGSGINSRVYSGSSLNGKKLSVVATSCGTDDIYSASVKANSDRLPFLRRALPRAAYPCHNDAAVILAAAAFAAHSRVALVFNEQPEPGGAVAVSTGTAGNAFTAPTVLPNSHGLAIFAVGAAYANGELFVIGSGPGGIYDWTQPAGGEWSDPAVIAATTATNSYSAVPGEATVASRGDRIVVGIARVESSQPDDSRPGVLTYNGNGWSLPATVRGGIGMDGGSVAIDPKTGVLHVAYLALRPRGKHFGIADSVFLDGHWTKPTFSAKGDHDRIEQVLVTPGHNTAVGFQAPS